MIYLQLYWPTSSTYMVWSKCRRNGTRENNINKTLPIYKSPCYVYMPLLTQHYIVPIIYLHDLRTPLQIHAIISLIPHRATGTLSLQRSSIWFLINHGGTWLVRNAKKHCNHMDININALALHVLQQQEGLGVILFFHIVTKMSPTLLYPFLILLLPHKFIFSHINYCFWTP